MDSNNKIPKVDHGVDICGDEWEEPEEVEKILDDMLPIPNKDDGYEKRYDPKHPYCTNWPVGHRKK